MLNLAVCLSNKKTSIFGQTSIFYVTAHKVQLVQGRIFEYVNADLRTLVFMHRCFFPVKWKSNTTIDLTIGKSSPTVSRLTFNIIWKETSNNIQIIYTNCNEQNNHQRIDLNDETIFSWTLDDLNNLNPV